METPEEYFARQARLDARYPNRHVVSTLQEFACYTADTNGEPVHLRNCASFGSDGAMQVTQNIIKKITKINII
jgi:hypothetical protein